MFGPAPASTTGAASTGDDVDHADVGHLERNTTGAAGSTDPAGRRWVEYSCTYPESSLLGKVTKSAQKLGTTVNGLPGTPTQR